MACKDKHKGKKKKKSNQKKFRERIDVARYMEGEKDYG